MSMEVEWLIISDAAQVVDKKLYIQGGGWDRLQVNTFPRQQSVGIALALRVPWNETNQQHTFSIEIVTEDGDSVSKLGGGFEVGRAPGIPNGQDQRVQMAVNVIMNFTAPGTFNVLARIDEGEPRRVLFNVVSPVGAVA